MSMSTTLKRYLHDQGVDYEVIYHPQTLTSMATAEQAHVPGDQLAKSVILEDEQGYLMAVIPATHKLELGTLKWQFNRRLGLATEQELGELFVDCETGSCPALGQAFGLNVVMDDSLSAYNDIYFETGDHTALVHVRGADFEQLMSGARRGYFSWHL